MYRPHEADSSDIASHPGHRVNRLVHDLARSACEDKANTSKASLGRLRVQWSFGLPRSSSAHDGSPPNRKWFMSAFIAACGLYMGIHEGTFTSICLGTMVVLSQGSIVVGYTIVAGLKEKLHTAHETTLRLEGHVEHLGRDKVRLREDIERLKGEE